MMDPGLTRPASSAGFRTGAVKQFKYSVDIHTGMALTWTRRFNDALPYIEPLPEFRPGAALRSESAARIYGIPDVPPAAR